MDTIRLEISNSFIASCMLSKKQNVLWRKHIKRVEDTNKVFRKEVRISFDEFADLDVVECTSRERSQDKKK